MAFIVNKNIKGFSATYCRIVMINIDYYYDVINDVGHNLDPRTVVSLAYYKNEDIREQDDYSFLTNGEVILEGFFTTVCECYTAMKEQIPEFEHCECC